VCCAPTAAANPASVLRRGYPRLQIGLYQTNQRHQKQTRAPVWQRNYYEHIIHGEDDLNRIRRYIRDNPAKWANDPDNPANIPKLPQHPRFARQTHPAADIGLSPALKAIR
jgi:hypothetical protein